MFLQEGGQALIMAARNLRAIYAQSTRTSTVAVAFLGFFFGCAHTARRPNSSPLRTDVGAHSSPTCAHLRAVYAQSARTFTVTTNFKVIFANKAKKLVQTSKYSVSKDLMLILYLMCYPLTPLCIASSYL